MSILSKLTSPLARSLAVVRVPQRWSHARVMPIIPSKMPWERFKDLLHFYFFIGAVPIFIIIAGFEICVGDCELRDIPEGYEPRYWEYERSPIAQTLLKYVYSNPQQEYEKLLDCYKYFDDMKDMRNYEKRVRMLMAERQDYKAWYYRTFTAKWIEWDKFGWSKSIDHFEGFNHLNN